MMETSIDWLNPPTIHTFFVSCRVDADHMNFAFMEKERSKRLRGYDKNIIRRRDFGFSNVFYEHFLIYVPLPPSIKWRDKYDCDVTIVASSPDEMTTDQIDRLEEKAADFIASLQAR